VSGLTPCGVCLQPAPADAMNRAGGMNVCDRCFHGGASDSVRARGWLLSATMSRFQVKETTFFTVVVTGKLDTPTPLTATFRMKSGVWMLAGLFGRTPTNDPLFNKMVYASGDTSMRSFLESDGAQSAVMDLVGELGTIHVGGSSVSVSVTQQDTAPEQARIEAEVAVLMAHVAAFGATQ
jgi:hypothetical protein